MSHTHTHTRFQGYNCLLRYLAKWRDFYGNFYGNTIASYNAQIKAQKCTCICRKIFWQVMASKATVTCAISELQQQLPIELTSILTERQRKRDAEMTWISLSRMT